MTGKKIIPEIEPDPNIRKRRRVVPAREAGKKGVDVVDELFAQAFAPRKTVISDDATNELSETFIISDVRDDKNETSDILPIKHPEIEDSDTREKQILTPEQEKLGHPNKRTSDTKAPEINSRTPEKIIISDTKTPRKNTSDTRENSKSTRKNYDSSYEDKRKLNTSIDRMNLRPAASIGKKIRVFCAEHSFELTEFFQLAAVAFIENFGHPSGEISDTKTPLDDRRLRLLYKTKSPIINLYLKYNSIFNEKTKWTVRDDDAASRLNDVDFRLIELGIIQTQANKNFSGKINSFNYYLPEINNFIELSMPEESIGMMLQINRQRWEKVTGKTIDLSFLTEQTQ